MSDQRTNEAPRRQAGASGVVIAVACAAFAFGMLGAAFASVPLYRLFCQVTGYGGTTQRAEAAPASVSGKCSPCFPV